MRGRRPRAGWDLGVRGSRVALRFQQQTHFGAFKVQKIRQKQRIYRDVGRFSLSQFGRKLRPLPVDARDLEALILHNAECLQNCEERLLRLQGATDAEIETTCTEGRREVKGHRWGALV